MNGQPSNRPGRSIMPAVIARTKEQIHGDEEAGTELKLGEFQNVTSLTHSEARLLIQAVLSHRAKGPNADIGETEVLIKTKDYLEQFARFKKKENVSAVERLLQMEGGLASFEKSQLGTLCCETSEEAKTLIPSISDKKSDEDLQELLDEITKFRTFVE
ncbi:RNA polymerase B [Orbilia blumenaviensis]|uniref:RNA polymerase B n=1 Tax=Orbilia blumenaviensis TaxID=1796055 RepID=A0AAV9TX63_9PEZI